MIRVTELAASGGCVLYSEQAFFISAKEAQEVIQPREERFPGAHAIGWGLAILAILMMVGAVAYGAWDGIRNGFSFGRFLRDF